MVSVSHFSPVHLVHVVHPRFYRHFTSSNLKIESPRTSTGCSQPDEVNYTATLHATQYCIHLWLCQAEPRFIHYQRSLPKIDYPDLSASTDLPESLSPLLHTDSRHSVLGHFYLAAYAKPLYLISVRSTQNTRTENHYYSELLKVASSRYYPKNLH